MTPDERHELELEMPFVAVASQGGPWEDDAFVAGWQACALDQHLAAGPDEHVATLLAGLREQADLIAMRRGYRAEFQHTDVEGWVWMRFTRQPVP